MVLFNTEAPFVVVLTGSMEPSYFRGDILAVTNNQDTFEVGDIIVYRFHLEDIPIVHRVISAQNDTKGKLSILTKGDNNVPDDRGLYYQYTGKMQPYLNREQILGRVRGKLPLLGMVTIWFTEMNKTIKLALICVLIIFTLSSKDPDA